MFISDVLRVKGYHVETIHLAASVELAVRKLAEHRIGALMVQDSWMKPRRRIFGTGPHQCDRSGRRPSTRLRGTAIDVETDH